MRAIFTSLAAAVLATAWPIASAIAQQTFPTPDAAAQALVSAAKSGDRTQIEQVLGPGSASEISTGNREEDERRLQQFNDAAAEKMDLTSPDDRTRVLTVGKNPFTFPIPIVKTGDSWAYDLDAGREEILNRRIGFDEESAIESCRTYVAAQREYFKLNPDGDEVQEYAQRILSTPGRRDGLYWEPENQADRSPLDGRIAQSVINAAQAAGRPVPYNGYFFRILKAQGPSAPGGAYNYVINGRMIAGFALVAYPAEWGRSGVMTFICNQSGKIYERNLGPRTAEKAAGMTRYEPGEDWTLVE